MYSLLLCLALLTSGTDSIRVKSGGMTFLDAGGRNITNSVFVRNGIGCGINISEFFLTGMANLETLNRRGNMFFSFALRARYNINIKKKWKIQTNLLFINDNANVAVKAMNYGLLFETDLKHWKFKTGLHFRHYYLSSTAKKDLGISNNVALVEAWNIMYNVGYDFFNPKDKFHLILNFTNVDFFMINQITNPMFNLTSTWSFHNNWQLFGALWYRSAGMLNGSVNPYEFFVRAGITWRYEI